MKKMLALAAVLALSATAFAQVQKTDNNKPAQATPAVPASSAKMQTSASAPAAHQMAAQSKPATMAGHMLSGKVVSVDAVANTLVIKGKKGDVTLNVDPAAKIHVGKETKLADLKAGNMVKVSYRMEGDQKVATKIW